MTVQHIHTEFPGPKGKMQLDPSMAFDTVIHHTPGSASQSVQQCTQDFIMEGVQQDPRGCTVRPEGPKAGVGVGLLGRGPLPTN